MEPQFLSYSEALEVIAEWERNQFKAEGHHKPGRGRRANPDADEWTRQTFLVRKAHRDKLRILAEKGGQTAKVTLDEVLRAFFIGKSVNPIPQN